jgi:hypothetical protein
MSDPGTHATVRHVTDESGQGWFEADALRRLVPVVALLVALVAGGTQPSSRSISATGAIRRAGPKRGPEEGNTHMISGVSKVVFETRDDEGSGTSYST